jgi:hypothetical protein
MLTSPPCGPQRLDSSRTPPSSASTSHLHLPCSVRGRHCLPVLTCALTAHKDFVMEKR